MVKINQQQINSKLPADSVFSSFSILVRWRTRRLSAIFINSTSVCKYSIRKYWNLDHTPVGELVVILTGEAANLSAAQRDYKRQVFLLERGNTWLTLFKPIYQMFTGWAGVAQAGLRAYLTLYMTFYLFWLSVVYWGLIAGFITSLDAFRWDYRINWFSYLG